MKKCLAATVLLILCVSPLRAGEDLAQAVAKDYETSLADLFVWFHSHPELSFREYETAARLAEELRAAGLEVTESVGGTGVVGMLRNGDGPLVMVRADMDSNWESLEYIDLRAEGQVVVKPRAALPEEGQEGEDG